MNETCRFKDVEEIFEGRLRGNQLMLSGKGLNAEEARLLWQSPRMQEISWLDLDDNDLGDQGVQGMVECAYLENVQYLNLNRNSVIGTPGSISLFIANNPLCNLPII